jgi:transcription antitermination factor NusG
MTEPDVVVMPEGEGGTPGEKYNNRPEVIGVQRITRIPMPQEYAPMPQNDEKKHWYAMRVTYSREVQMKENLEQRGIECFIPMRYHTRVIRGRKVKILKPVIHNLLFAHASKAEIQEAKKYYDYLQYMIDREHQKIIVPDAQMQTFIAVAGTYDDQLIWVNPEDLNLKKGTRVRITAGDFAGQEGTFVKVKGARDKRVVIAIKGVIAVAMATLHPSLIEVIQ